MSNTIIKITEKGKASYGAIVCLPKAAIEMRDYSKVNPHGLTLSPEELEYAKAHGLDAVLDAGLVIFAGMEKPVPAVAVTPLPKAEEPVKDEAPVEKKTVEHTEKMGLMVKEENKRKANAKKNEVAPEPTPEKTEDK